MCSPASARAGVELDEERLGIQHDAVPHDAHRALQDARGDLVQHELACGGVDRVARVRAALIAHDEVGALGEHVDDLPLALVPPLSADDHDAVDLGSEHGDRKSTRLNSSHGYISYAVFCLKKKKKYKHS